MVVTRRLLAKQVVEGPVEEQEGRRRLEEGRTEVPWAAEKRTVLIAAAHLPAWTTGATWRTGELVSLCDVAVVVEKGEAQAWHSVGWCGCMRVDAIHLALAQPIWTGVTGTDVGRCSGLVALASVLSTMVCVFL